LGPILWAVPKKKTSHSKKRMRSANKGLKDKTNIIDCPGCGQKHLIHHLCFNCYKDFNYREK
ncbi:ribosomal L32p protein family-domain-containing protein, partial [Glomus cerebriforme]